MIERKVVDGNVTAYYEREHDIDVKPSLVIEVRSLMVGSLPVDVSYREKHFPSSGESHVRQIRIETENIVWKLLSCGGYPPHVTADPETRQEKATGEAEAAMEWQTAFAYRDDGDSTPERKQKAAAVFDAVYARLLEIPVAERYISGFEQYIQETEASVRLEQQREGEAGRLEREQERARLREKHAGEPDPLDELVVLFCPSSD